MFCMWIYILCLSAVEFVVTIIGKCRIFTFPISSHFLNIRQKKKNEENQLKTDMEKKVETQIFSYAWLAPFCMCLFIRMNKALQAFSFPKQIFMALSLVIKNKE